MVTLRSLLWATKSSRPVTVTVCLLFQLLGVNVNMVGLTVAAATPYTLSCILTTEISTFPVGWVFSTTV